MAQASLPPDEAERLETLRGYEILDTAPEQVFDDITLLASHVCGTPIALITLLDENRQWFKSKVGLSVSETSRDLAFCAHAILETDIFVVEDAETDQRFASNPFVTGDAKIRFYAGSPLVTSEGHALGTLCVIDRVPRELGAEQRTALQALSRQVVAQIELRHGLRELRKTTVQLQGAKEDLMEKTAFLEAQMNSSPDGILVVDPQGRSILQNRRAADLLKIPSSFVDAADREKQLEWVASQTKDPARFFERIVYLDAHPDEISRDEIEMRDGTVLDRYSAPIIGTDGKHYGKIRTFRDITEQKRTEESLRLLGSAVEQSKESILITEAELDLPGPRIVFVNPAFMQTTGYTAEEAIGKTPRILQGPRTDRTVMNRLRRNLADGETFAGETINYRKDGQEFDMEWQIAPIRDAGGKVTHFVAVQRDISERKRLETQLVQSQKVESVGQLAGGIAHEFNSLLTAIIGQSELLLADLPIWSPLAKNATEISKAAGRAATLTRQLLAYGRKQFLQPESLDLNRVITATEGMFHHFMGGDVTTRLVPASDLQMVRVDLGQIEQVIMNMAINSRHAMPNGGTFTLATANVSFGEADRERAPELKPGDYVMLTITDTGVGMSAEVQARVFEPFFTTKGVGEGTGLGLSTCYGIIKQSGGHISVQSEPAHGTTFKIYLPQVERRMKTPPQRLDSPDLPPGTETILLVEDDPALRETAAALLKRLGYTVFPAANGIEALSLRQQHDIGHIDLLFTDVLMPQMSGKELSERVRALYPHTKILFTSTYTEKAIVHEGGLDHGVVHLQKPFTPSALARKLREVLDW